MAMFLSSIVDESPRQLLAANDSWLNSAFSAYTWLWILLSFTYHIHLWLDMTDKLFMITPENWNIGFSFWFLIRKLFILFCSQIKLKYFKVIRVSTEKCNWKKFKILVRSGIKVKINVHNFLGLILLIINHHQFPLWIPY